MFTLVIIWATLVVLVHAGKEWRGEGTQVDSRPCHNNYTSITTLRSPGTDFTSKSTTHHIYRSITTKKGSTVAETRTSRSSGSPRILSTTTICSSFVSIPRQNTTFCTTTTAVISITPTPTPSTPSSTSVYNTCPTACSVSAGTVNLFYWPTLYPYTYPPTFVDTALGYTFTSPSVYMVVNTIQGFNSLGPTPPSATNKIFALDLDEVSTIDLDSGTTRQLTLNDLGTDCPQTAAPSVIATLKPNSRCDPILAAPSIVRSWASPCGACGPFGLFDPPYAIPTVTGTVVTPIAETTVSTSHSTSSTASTSIEATTASSSTHTSDAGSQTDTSAVVPSTPLSSSSLIAASPPLPSPSSVQTALAARETASVFFILLALFLAPVLT